MFDPDLNDGKGGHARVHIPQGLCSSCHCEMGCKHVQVAFRFEDEICTEVDYETMRKTIAPPRSRCEIVLKMLFYSEFFNRILSSQEEQQVRALRPTILLPKKFRPADENSHVMDEEDEQYFPEEILVPASRKNLKHQTRTFRVQGFRRRLNTDGVNLPFKI